MAKEMNEEVLCQYQEWLSQCPIQFHAHGFGSKPTIDNDGKKEIISGKRYFAHSGKDPGAKDPQVICYYKWDETNKKFTKHHIADNVGTGLFIQTADLNKNGFKDIVVAGKSGTYILFNKGNK